MPKSYLTLTDVAQMTNNGNIMKFVHEFQKHVSLFNSLPMRASSEILKDHSAVVEEIPGGTWTGLDRDVKPNKGRFGKREENIALIEGWSEYNEKTMMVAPDSNALRWEHDALHVAGMSLDAETGLLYGNPDVDEYQPLGFMPRMNAVTDNHAMKSGVRQKHVCLSAGGTNSGKMGSILLVGKGPQAASLIYPKNVRNGGLMFDAYGFENMKGEEGGYIRRALSHFQLMFGLSINNRQTACRIANIDVTDPTSVGKISDALYEAFASIPREYRASVDIWAPADVILAMRKAYNERVKPATYNDAIPRNAIGDVQFDRFVIQQCDSMLMTEATVA